ncbi:hypothetical protein [Halalkalibacter okhensis]|uniref:Amidase n=1 Tax=Halalkalibacter okhensis TaxID=333138 RepID=A0A0B0II25_9BACI|nr:hypothetical protein [Halalkalibacter okhensis]KHF39724.1 hypothetical protein LQ50_13970 [Halalkalibacter okhensis]
MRKSVYLIILLGVISTIMMAFYERETKIESTWIWDTQRFIDNKEPYFQFLEQNNITKLYVQIDPGIAYEKYESMIGEATARGMVVFAIDGAKDWVYSTEELRYKLGWLHTYHLQVGEASQFSGLLVDVEPYLLPEWEKEQLTLLTGYVKLIDEAADFTRKHNLPFEVAIPFWFHELELRGQRFLDVLGSSIDTFVIMSYRTDVEGENGLFALVSPYFENDIEVDIVLTVETERLQGEEKYISFSEKSEQEMFRFINQLNKHYRDDNRFQGVSVHHVDSWMDLSLKNEE